MRKETVAIRSQLNRSEFQEHSVPLYMTSSYVFEDAAQMRRRFSEEEKGNIYSRYSNPNVSEFIEKMALLEGAESGWATASGMAAVFTVLGALLKSGDHIVSSRAVFGSTHKLLTEILPKWGITCTYVDAVNYMGYAEAIQANTRLVYLETPSNPGLEIIDLQRITALTSGKGITVVVDNCFATPFGQQPLPLGADISIHSATKFIDGQGRSLGGVILGSSELIKKIEGFARHTGPCISPFNAWLLSKSLETLSVRFERHSSSAHEIARRLEEHSKVDWVRYPFLTSHPDYELAKRQMQSGGAIVTFQIKGGQQSGQTFLNSLQLFSLTANLGDTRSIATHPASTTHSKLTREERASVGISDGLIRLSIGLEHPEDIWDDIEKALEES
ncbi:O-succinylhomoserine sulfhydrylase [Wandonia haliotis]|uniref:O-succinylhomoserine sulfhydrylase n=1 Tax=Wandonia haliotis TaxID=574963 RepID=A0ABP3Y337_9FLAO